MDLREGSISWHRTRQWLDEEINRPRPEEYVNEWYEGFTEGHRMALMKVRIRFNTEEENRRMEETRKEMFNG